MTSREELIEEALHAYHGVENRGHRWGWSQESITSMRAAFAVFEKAQGEPTDAQVDAALQEWWYGEHEDTWEAKMRAALRAAAAVREEGQGR